MAIFSSVSSAWARASRARCSADQGVKTCRRFAQDRPGEPGKPERIVCKPHGARRPVPERGRNRLTPLLMRLGVTKSGQTLRGGHRSHRTRPGRTRHCPSRTADQEHLLSVTEPLPVRVRRCNRTNDSNRVYAPSLPALWRAGRQPAPAVPATGFQRSTPSVAAACPSRRIGRRARRCAPPSLGHG